MVEPTLPSKPSPPEVVSARPVSARPYSEFAPPSPSPLELPGITRRGAWLDLMLIILGALFVPFGFQIVAGFWTEDVQPGADFIDVLTIQKWFDVLLAGGLLTYLLLRHRLAPACFGLRLDCPGGQMLWSLGGLVATYAWMFMTILVVGMLVLLFPALQKDILTRTEMFELMPLGDLRRTVLLLIPVAIHEEILFRGLLLPYLRRLTGNWWSAIVLCSGVFAVLHFDQGGIGMLQVLGIGTILGIFFVLSRSLIAVIVAHFVFNFLQFQLIRLIPELPVA